MEFFEPKYSLTKFITILKNLKYITPFQNVKYITLYGYLAGILTELGRKSLEQSFNFFRKNKILQK